MRKKQSIQSLTIEKLKALSVWRSGYNPKPFYKMTDEEVRAFAIRQALDASTSIRMTRDEIRLYAGAVYESILYFNRIDKRHEEYMKYLKAVGDADRQRVRWSDIDKKPPRPDVVYF